MTPFVIKFKQYSGDTLNITEPCEKGKWALMHVERQYGCVAHYRSNVLVYMLNIISKILAGFGAEFDKLVLMLL